jgi:hypothetical protein
MGFKSLGTQTPGFGRRLRARQRLCVSTSRSPRRQCSHDYRVEVGRDHDPRPSPALTARLGPATFPAADHEAGARRQPPRSERLSPPLPSCWPRRAKGERWPGHDHAAGQRRLGHRPVGAKLATLPPPATPTTGDRPGHQPATRQAMWPTRPRASPRPTVASATRPTRAVRATRRAGACEGGTPYLRSALGTPRTRSSSA